MRVNIYVKERGSLIATTWWKNFRAFHGNRSGAFWIELRNSELKKNNLSFYGSQQVVSNYAIEGDEKDIFEFIMRWS